MSNAGEFVSQGGSNDFEAVNDEDAYKEPWELNDPDALVHEADVAERGTLKPLSSVSSGDGTATVRLNVPMTYDIGIPFNGSLSGTVVAGSTLTGRDSNNNRIPDLLESCIRSNRCRF